MAYDMVTCVHYGLHPMTSLMPLATDGSPARIVEAQCGPLSMYSLGTSALNAAPIVLLD
jgi:hypothetical protein